MEVFATRQIVHGADRVLTGFKKERVGRERRGGLEGFCGGGARKGRKRGKQELPEEEF